MISTTYDSDADALYVRVAQGAITDTRELEPGLILDLDVAGHVVGIEILDLRARSKATVEAA